MDTNKRFKLRGENAGPFEIETDPTRWDGFRKDINHTHLMDACGILPALFVAQNDGTQPFKEALEQNYEYGTHWHSRATVSDDLVYQYPEDEPLHPLAVLTNTATGERGAIYRSGIVAVEDGNGGWVSAVLD